MNSYHDPELDDVLQDEELRHLATVLHSAGRRDPPVDDAFRTALRRQLMQQAWAMAEGRERWWRRLFAPPGLAWVGATAGLVLIAAVVVATALQQPGGLNTVYVASPVDGNRSVPLQQPILVAFNQPMDHQTTQDAVQITPATSVAYSWDSQSRTLAVQPVGGNLAPNTQYQVTIGAGARTQAGQPLATPQTITFVTQPPPTPTPLPTVRPSPTNPLGEKPIASLNGANTLSARWSSDSSSLYYLDGKGALVVVAIKDGTATVVAPDGASSPSLSLAGDRLAYLRGGKIEILDRAAGKTDELTVTPTPLLVGWSKDRVLWVAADGVYAQSGEKSAKQLVALAAGASALSIAPDGAHVVYRQDANLFILDLASGNITQLGQTNTDFAGWSPNGAFLMFTSGDTIAVADPQGTTQATIPSGDASWSTQDAILLGSDTQLYQLWSDGTGGTKVVTGTYRSPLWAPNGTAFVFVRGGNIWTGVVPGLAPKPTPVDEAGKVVSAFMDARVKGQTNEAMQLLDQGGKKAYGSEGGLSLLIPEDPHLSRYYVLTAEQVGSKPDTVQVVVRLVLSHGKLDVRTFEETLTLVRETKSKLFFIDQAGGAPRHDLGKGAQVVGVEITGDTVKVTFDSDLDPGTVSGGIHILDSKGRQLDTSATYSNRIVTLSGFDLKEDGQYRLVVLTAVRDVLGQNIPAEYDLDLIGPVAAKHGNQGGNAAALAGPSPTPTLSQSPAPAPPQSQSS